MRASVLSVLTGLGEPEIDPAAEFRDTVVNSLLAFVGGVRELSCRLPELRATLDVARATSEGEFTHTAWRAALPELRKLRAELEAIEQTLAPREPTTARASKKTKKTHH
jgi:hypothetical protein